MKSMLNKLSLTEKLMISIGVIGCLVFYIVTIVLGTDYPILSKLGETLITTLLVTFILGIITNRFFFQEIHERIAEVTQSSKNSLALGLADVTLSFDDINYSNLIQGSRKRIIISVIYSNTWIKRHIASIRDLLTEHAVSVEIMLLDPTAQCAKDYDTKFNAGENTNIPLQERIVDTVNIIKGIFQGVSNLKGSIAIYQQRLPYSYALYCFDEKTVIIPYLNAPGRTSKVPTFVYSERSTENNIFAIYINDYGKIKEKYSSEIWKYAKSNA